jgi:uncharacterized membrane protein
MWMSKIKQNIRRTFLTGLFVFIPIGVTIIILVWLFRFLDNLLAPIVKFVMLKTIGIAKPVPGLGFLIGIVLVFAIGIIATNYFGKKLIKLGDYIVAKIPVVNNIYSGSKQIVESFTIQKEKAFRETVLIEYPRKGIYTVGLVTFEVKGMLKNVNPQKLVHVFIPSTPSPVNGFLYLVPADQIIHLDMSTEEAIKYIVSLGMVIPNNKKVGSIGEESEKKV